MDHLSKQQIILLALLVSFVTSLATGIVTVSLMDQAPTNMTRTITQVIQKTVATAVPTNATNTAAVAIAVSDQVADATAKITASLVRIREGETGAVGGLGVIVSKNGTVMTDKNVIDKLNAPSAVFYEGGTVPISLSRFQVEGDIAFLVPIRPIFETRPISFGGNIRLGETVWTLSGTTTYTLSQGIVTRLEKKGGQGAIMIETSIGAAKLLPGTPLFDATGAVVGLATDNYAVNDGSVFYPIESAKSGIPR